MHVDPLLARATSDMLGVYRATLIELPPEGQAHLAESQRLWVRYAAERCQIAQDLAARTPAPRNGARRETITQCLIRAANDRQGELRGALVTVGSWVFLRTIDHRIRPTYGEHGGEVVEEAVARLRLAKPSTDEQRRWDGAVNRLLDQTIATAYDLADGDPRSSAIELHDTSLRAGVDVASTSPDLIDVAIHAAADPAGPAPPQTSARHLIWSMRLDRPIDPTDLFDPRTLWRPSLAQIAADRLENSPLAGASAQTVQADTPLVGDPSRWSLKPWGLAVDLRAPTPGAAPAWTLAPWPLLAPYLKHPLFVDPASLTPGPRG